jgi:hypothetical protein
VHSNDSREESATLATYRSPTLSNGQHTLTVTNLANSTTSGFAFTLDFFLVLTSDGAVSALSSSGTTANTTTNPIPSASVGSNSNITHNGTTTSTASIGFLTTTIIPGPFWSAPYASPSQSPTLSTEPIKLSSRILIIVGPIFGAIVICGIIYISLRGRWKQNEPDAWITSTRKSFSVFLIWLVGLMDSVSS